MGEIKRQEMMAAQKEGGKKSSGPAMDARKELSIHRRTEEPQSGGRRQISANTQKLFPEKKLAVTTGKKLVDLRDAAFKLFEVVQKPSGGCLPSPSNCYRPNAWVLVVQLGCEK